MLNTLFSVSGRNPLPDSSAIYKHIHKDDEKKSHRLFIRFIPPRFAYSQPSDVPSPLIYKSESAVDSKHIRLSPRLQNTFRCSFNLKTVFNGKISRLRLGAMCEASSCLLD